MNPGQLLVALRDHVYDTINTKKGAGGFSINDFNLTRTWRPWTSLEILGKENPKGIVYVIGGNFLDAVNQSRSNITQQDFAVMLGYQRLVNNINDHTEIDAYVEFCGELQDLLRLEVDSALVESFRRIEFLRDPEGLPLSFIMLRQAHTFESYFTAYYDQVLEGYSALTTTTTTT